MRTLSACSESIKRATWYATDAQCRRLVKHFSVFLLLVLVPLAFSAGRIDAGEKTEVTVFRPPVPNGPSRSGECWTDSIAVSRSGCWRCRVGNEIYDPCFSSAGLTGAVICDANPAKGTAGFILKLAKPLPKPFSQGPTYTRPWLVKLADKTTCEIQTGTTALVAGLAVRYACSDVQQCSDNGCAHMTGLTNQFQHGKVWKAVKLTFKSSDKGLQLISRKRIAITAVWE